MLERAGGEPGNGSSLSSRSSSWTETGAARPIRGGVRRDWAHPDRGEAHAVGIYGRPEPGLMGRGIGTAGSCPSTRREGARPSPAPSSPARRGRLTTSSSARGPLSSRRRRRRPASALDASPSTSSKASRSGARGCARRWTLRARLATRRPAARARRTSSRSSSTQRRRVAGGGACRRAASTCAPSGSERAAGTARLRVSVNRHTSRRLIRPVRAALTSALTT